ncbi:MAG: SPFH domain-containing protein [Patescibacteria group bacterium]
MTGPIPLICQVKDNHLVVLGKALSGTVLERGKRRGLRFILGPKTSLVVLKWHDMHIGTVNLRKLPVDVPAFETNTALPNLAEITEGLKKNIGDTIPPTLIDKIMAAVERGVIGGTPTVFINLSTTFEINRDGEDPAIVKDSAVSFLTELSKDEFQEIIQQKVEAAINFIFGDLALNAAMHLTREEKKEFSRQLMEIINWGGYYALKTMQTSTGEVDVEPQSEYSWEWVALPSVEGLDRFGIKATSVVIQNVKASPAIQKAIDEQEAMLRDKEVLEQYVRSIQNITYPQALALALLLGDVNFKGFGAELSVNSGGKKSGKSPDKSS